MANSEPETHRRANDIPMMGDVEKLDLSRPSQMRRFAPTFF